MRFMWARAWNALRNRLIAATVVVALCGTPCALLGVLALEFLVANLLAIVALHRSRSILKGAGHARFSPQHERTRRPAASVHQCFWTGTRPWTYTPSHTPFC